MKKCYALFVFVFCMPLLNLAQNDTIQWLNTNAIPLTSKNTNKDLLFLSTTLKDNIVLGLGEASHGTKEFYQQKSEIIKHLITHLDYKLFGIEMDSTYMAPINRYVQNGAGDLKNLMQGLYLYNTREIYDLFEWIKTYNKTRSASEKVTLFGYDRQEFMNDIFAREEHMAANIITTQKSYRQKTIVWAHNIHIAKDLLPGAHAIGHHLKETYGKGYYAIAFDTYKGAVNVLENTKIISHAFQTDYSFSALFAKAKYTTFFLPLNAETATALGATNTITNIYSVWKANRSIPLTIGSDFDALIFIRQTTPSTILSQPKQL